MKKTMISAAFAALLAAGGYFGYNTTSPSEEGMSDLMLANAEALSDPEAWVEFEYSTCCYPAEKEYCAKGPYSVFERSQDCEDYKKKHPEVPIP